MDRMIKWDITYNCNLRCKHCYNSEYFEKSESELVSNQTLLEVIEKFKYMGVTRIHFLGGEPLLSNKLLPVLYLAKINNIVTTITTNGLLLTLEMSKILFDLNVLFICISLEGISESTNDQIRGKNTFSTVIENIKNAVKLRKDTNSNTKIYITLTINKMNISECSTMLAFIDFLGVDGLLITSLDKQGNAINNWSDMGITIEEKVVAIESIVSEKVKYPNMHLEIVCKNILSEYLYKKYDWKNCYLELDKNFCNGTDEEYYVQPDGRMLPCHNCTISNHQSVLKNNSCEINFAPNLFKDNVEEILSNTFFNEFFSFTRRIGSYQNASNCLSCKYSYKCLPCPLKCSTRYVSTECEYSKKLLNQLNKETLNKIIRIKPNLLINELYRENIRILNLETQDEIVLDDIEMEIWEIISHSEIKICNLIDTLYGNYQNSVSYEEFINDLLDFSFELKVKGFVELI